jgi:hypothetical protein
MLLLDVHSSLAVAPDMAAIVRLTASFAARRNSGSTRRPLTVFHQQQRAASRQG